MSAKTSVALDDSLVAEARRLAGTRTASAAVNAALREFVRNRGRDAERAEEQAEGKTEERKGKTPSDSWDALEALTREMREGGWDGYDYKEFRRRWGRRLAGHDFG